MRSASDRAFVCAGGAVQFVAPSLPLRGPYLLSWQKRMGLRSNTRAIPAQKERKLILLLRE